MADVIVRFRQAWRIFEPGQVVSLPADTAEILCLPHVSIAEPVTKPVPVERKPLVVSTERQAIRRR